MAYLAFAGFYCDDIPHIPNTLQPTELVRYKDGDLAAFQCKTGYDLIGTDSILCHNPDGRHEMAQWGDQFPVCCKYLCRIILHVLLFQKIIQEYMSGGLYSIVIY